MRRKWLWSIKAVRYLTWLLPLTMAARIRIPLREHSPNHLAMQRTLKINILFFIYLFLTRLTFAQDITWNSCQLFLVCIPTSGEDALYLAPELLRIEEGLLDSVYGTKEGDLFAFGIIMQEVTLWDQPYALERQYQPLSRELSNNVGQIYSSINQRLVQKFKCVLFFDF